MANEYSFKRETCYCGADLAEVKAETSGLYRGSFPMGKCPGCGRLLLLDAPPVEPEMPVPEPPAKARSSRKTAEPEMPVRAPKTEPEPVAEPEAE